MRTEIATFTNMCMIKEGSRILVQNRVSKSYPGLAFPGGHVEKEESFTDALVREVYEETGLTVLDPKLCGMKQFTTTKDGRYEVLLYIATSYTGTLRSSEEGDVFWIDLDAVDNFNLSSDFKSLLEVFLGNNSELFYHQVNGKYVLDLK